MWSIEPVVGSEGARAARDVFGFGDKPTYTVITGTKWASTPAGDLLAVEARWKMGDLLDAIAYHGNVPDSVVRADLTVLKAKLGAELDRRSKLMDEAQKLMRQSRARPSRD
jgi:hypothetical protein